VYYSTPPNFSDNQFALVRYYNLPPAQVISELDGTFTIEVNRLDLWPAPFVFPIGTNIVPVGSKIKTIGIDVGGVDEATITWNVKNVTLNDLPVAFDTVKGTQDACPFEPFTP